MLLHMYVTPKYTDAKEGITTEAPENTELNTVRVAGGSSLVTNGKVTQGVLLIFWRQSNSAVVLGILSSAWKPV